MGQIPQTASVQAFPCGKCGATLEFRPGTLTLVCPYCGHSNAIEVENDSVVELPMGNYLDKAHLDYTEESERVAKCNTCSAEYTIGPTEVAKVCPFCGSTKVSDCEPAHRIQPNGILPFVLDEKKARECASMWLGSRFWAPNDLRKMALKEGRLQGVYLPYWTFDSQTVTQYTGMRGEHYYETETYTDWDDGTPVTRTRTVRRTRWYPASGVVDVPFDDVLILGSTKIEPEYARQMTRWPLHQLYGYQPKLLVGFHALRYDRDLATCWSDATVAMDPIILDYIRHDIGGDEQQVHSKNTQYNDNTFKHVLLPIWAGGYRYRGKPYQFIVNGQNGMVLGSAPISFWKVFFAVLLGLILVGVIGYFYVQSRANSSSGSSSSPAFGQEF